MLDVMPRPGLERLADGLLHRRAILRVQDLLVRLVRTVERTGGEAVHDLEAFIPRDDVGGEIPLPRAESGGGRCQAGLAGLRPGRWPISSFVRQIPDHAGHGPSVLRIAVLNSSTVSARRSDTARLSTGGRRTTTGRWSPAVPILNSRGS